MQKESAESAGRAQLFMIPAGDGSDECDGRSGEIPPMEESGLARMTLRDPTIKLASLSRSN